jgi:hypothetical protein
MPTRKRIRKLIRGVFIAGQLAGVKEWMTSANGRHCCPRKGYFGQQ